MMLWGSAAAFFASVAGIITVGSTYIFGELAAVAFAVSLFTLICAAEAES